MTDKLHCPFCGAELVQANTTVKKIWHCPNIDCKGHNYFGVDDFWNTIISGKKAQDALKIVDGKLKVIANDENPSPIQSQALDCYIQIAKDCRDTITSITKQEK